MTHRGRCGNIVETRRNESEFSFEWQIPDFFSLTSEPGDRYGSPSFHFCDSEWSLAMHPNGTLRSALTGFVTLFLFRDDKGLPKTFNVTVGIRGAEGVENKKEKGQEFSGNDPACCWFGFTTLSELRKHESRLVPDGILKIAYNMKKIVFPAARDASCQTDGIFGEAEVLTDENKSLENRGIEKLSEDIAKLLANDENSDVTVQVGDTEFSVHRNILSVRSPVLSAMFKHKTAERESNRITIEDCEPVVFRDFLQYLYRGSVQSLTQQNVFSLYCVADKYLADDLKSHCLQHIRDTLCVQTFCDTMKLALTYDESDLFQKAINFAKENIQSIIISVEWQNFICEYPRQANEILIRSIGPRS